VESNLYPLYGKVLLIQDEKGKHDWDTLQLALNGSLDLLQEIFVYFSSMEASSAEGDTMNVTEFMQMMDSLEMCDHHLSLSATIDIFVRCNQEECMHFLGEAVDGSRLEEEMEMEFEEYRDALLQCAMMKKKTLEAAAGGKPIRDEDAVFMMLRQMSSGWKNWQAVCELRKLHANASADFENRMLSLTTETVEPLRRGRMRITVKTLAK